MHVNNISQKKNLVKCSDIPAKSEPSNVAISLRFTPQTQNLRVGVCEKFFMCWKCEGNLCFVTGALSPASASCLQNKSNDQK